MMIRDYGGEMLKLFSRKNKTAESFQFYDNNHLKTSYSYNSIDDSTNQVNTKMGRLIELIGYAIEEWAFEYNLENLPPKIILEQVLDVMHVIELNLNK